MDIQFLKGKNKQGACSGQDVTIGSWRDPESLP